jgi:hypothetical protein
MLIVLGLVLLAPVAVHAQQGGGISGVLRDAERGDPIAGAHLVLQPEPAGAMPARVPGGPLTWESARSTASDRTGRYRFSALAPGRYRLSASRLGYETSVVTVEIRGAAEARVSLELRPRAVQIPGVDVLAEEADPYGPAAAHPATLDARRSRTLARPRPTLSGDARELTHADVSEAVTLGEADLFRALQRIPGVSTRDDYSAELWIRGGGWGQTRVYLDGMPLYNPLHGVGLLAGLNAGAIGSAWLHPGVRPASIGDGAAGVVEVTTRPGRGDGRVNALAELSVASGGLAADQRLGAGRAAWMISARRAHLDWFTAALSRLTDRPELHIPYTFTNLNGRVDVRLGRNAALEASGILQRDYVRDDIPGALVRNRADWGNVGAQATVHARSGNLQLRNTIGGVQYGAYTFDLSALVPGDIRTEEPSFPRFDPHTEPEASNRARTAFVQGELYRPGAESAPARWAVGYQLAAEEAEYTGPAPYVGPGGTRPGHLVRDGGLWRGALWGETRWAPAERLRLSTGLRLERSGAGERVDAVRAAPRALLSYRAAPWLTGTAAWGRSHQYLQTLAPVGPRFGGFYASELMLLAGGGVPILESDVATLGVEMWPSPEWMLAAHVYDRHSRGEVHRDVRAGGVGDRAIFLVGETEARGLELSARRVAGRWTGSAGYTLGRAETEIDRLRFAAAHDRRHSLDAALMVRLNPGLRVGGAFSARTGAPFTRAYGEPGAAPPADQVIVAFEAPHGERAPAYASLDLLLDRSARWRGVDLGAFLQLRNALGRQNSAVYRGSTPEADEFDPGIPRLPVVGLRARF